MTFPTVVPNNLDSETKLHTAGAAAAVLGAAVSLILLLMAGINTPLLLLIMFVGWVVHPFALLGAGIVSTRVSDRTHTALAITSLVVALVSIGIYSYFTIYPLSTTPARTWLLTPALSLIVIAVVFLSTRSGKDQNGEIS